MNGVLEIEVAGPRGAALFFQPLQRTLRGRIDPRELPEATREVEREWPRPIPGQRIGCRPDGTAYVLEPLRDGGNEDLAAKVAAARMSLPPLQETFQAVSVPTWLFWMTRAVAAGHAVVTAGELPARIEGRVQMHFVTPEPPAHPEKARADRLEALLFALLTPKQQESYKDALADLEAGAGRAPG